MNLNNILRLLAVGIVALAIGYGTGYFYSPTKVREVEKIVEKEKKTVEENKKIVERFDPNTGKLTERIEETGKKETETNTKKKEKELEKQQNKKMWAFKAGGVVNPRDLEHSIVPRVGTEVRLPVFNSWLGAEADISINRPLFGLYLRVEF
jgi:hypothetical protein